jgi:hypothetical protein
MSTLKIETEIENPAQTPHAVEIIDCGRASERTQGVVFTLFWEPGTAPTNKLFLF